VYIKLQVDHFSIGTQRRRVLILATSVRFNTNGQ